jgi:hypothetical protein
MAFSYAIKSTHVRRVKLSKSLPDQRNGENQSRTSGPTTMPRAKASIASAMLIVKDQYRMVDAVSTVG